MAETIKVRYLSDKVGKLGYIGGKSDWIDLRVSEDVELKQGDFKLIPLGIAMQLPAGYETHIVSRSSTYKNFGIIQTNHIGIVDESYCGDNDQMYAADGGETDVVRYTYTCPITKAGFSIYTTPAEFGGWSVTTRILRAALPICARCTQSQHQLNNDEVSDCFGGEVL